MYIRLRKARHHSRVICLLLFVGCPLCCTMLLARIYLIRFYFFMCVFTRRSYTHSSLVQLQLTIFSLYQVDVQDKHARNEKHFNSTKRKHIERRFRAIYFYWYYNTRSSPAYVKRNTRSREYLRKIQNFSNYLPFGNYANFGNYPDTADVIIGYNRSRKTSSKYNIFATSPLSGSASIRVHVEVRNG